MKKNWTITLIFLAINLSSCKHENVESGMKDDELITVSPGFEKFLIESKIDRDPIANGKIPYGSIKEIDSLTITLPGNRNSLKGLDYFTNLKYLKYNNLIIRDLCNKLLTLSTNSFFIPLLSTKSGK